MRVNSLVLCLLSYLPKCTAHRGDLCLRAPSSSTSQLVTLRDYPWWTQMELNHQVLLARLVYSQLASPIAVRPYVRLVNLGQIRQLNALAFASGPLVQWGRFELPTLGF